MLAMSQRAITPRGDFEARDQLSLASSGERLIFERVITNDRGERTVDGRVGYIIGAYGYGDQAASSDRGQFILTLRQREDGHWLIVADLDAAIRQ